MEHQRPLEAKTFGDKIKQWYTVYLLRTSLWSLEPWERNLFNSVLLIFTSMGCYTAYVYLPRYTRSVLTYFGLL